MTRRLSRTAALTRTLCGVAAVALSAAATPARAQDAPATDAATDPRPDPTVSTNLPGGVGEPDFIDPDFTLEVTLDRPLPPGERLALWVGDQDVTGLARGTAEGLRYSPGLIPLPRGRSDVVVHRVTGDRWRELTRIPIRVRSRLGFETGTLSPRLSLGLDGQVAEHHDPDAAAPARPTYEDLEGELSLEARQLHRAGSVSAKAKVFGTSYREKAIRFRDEGEEAPRVDLAEYVVTAERDGAALTFGHLRTGDHRHLIQGHSSRGAELVVEAGDRVEMSAAIAGGARIVGWDNPFGAGDPDHRIWNANLGVEALPTPGALRVDLIWMGGSVLPISGFNRGAVVDAETSSGVGVRVRARGLDRRLTLDAGLSRSTFDNPDDPALQQDTALVGVVEEDGVARYLDASFDLLRDIAVGSRTARLSVGFNHERVDPLYRTVGTRVSADNLTNQLDLTADVAGVSVQATFASGEDNLGEIASILKSHTDRTGVTVGLPMDRVTGVSSPWLPRVQLRMDRTHQFGEELPENGGFSESHVPDQVSDRRSATLDWRWSRFSLGYRWDGSVQDNRQEGRDDADIEGSSNALRLGFAPTRSLSLSLDLGIERSENRERDEVDQTHNLGGRVEWSPFDRSTVTLRWARTETEDREETRERVQSTLDAQLTSAVPGMTPVDGRFYLRFSRRESERLDRTLDLTDSRETWTVTSGFSIALERR